MSQLLTPGPRRGRMAESIPVLPLDAGAKHAVLKNAYRERSPPVWFGLHVSANLGAQPSEPVIRRFSVVAPTPCTLYSGVSGAPEDRLVIPDTCQLLSTARP